MRRLPVTSALLTVLVALSASAQEPAPGKVVAVYGFGANPAAAPQAPAVEALIASGLVAAPGLKVITQADLETLISNERQKQLLGAGEEPANCDTTCMTELAGAAGARFVISGRVDRFGDAYVLSANLFDSNEARVLTKARADAADEGAIPTAAATVSRQLLEGLGVEVTEKPEPAPSAPSPPAAPTPSAEEKAHRFSLGLHIGNSFLQNIAALNLSGDVELGWQFSPSWVAFVQVGVTLVRADNALFADQFGLVPSVIGVRSLYRIDHSFQPYWGFGLGVQLTLGDYAVIGQTGPLPTLMGFLGFQYLITQRFSLGIEGSTNVAQWVLGVNSAQGGRGFNLDLKGTVAWRF